MAIKLPSGLTSRQRYQQPTEEELQQQQRASALAARDAANPRAGQPGQPAPSQRELASTQKPGIFDAPEPEKGMAAPTGPAMEAMKAAGGNLGDVGSRRPTTTAEGDAARRPPPAAPAQEEKKGSIFDVDTEGERAAFQQELEANRAKAMQQAEARAGLAGMGLSGATGQLVSDVGRQQQRAGQLAMGEFERQQSAAQFRDVQRQASIWDLEQAENQDIDGDGFRGNPALDERPGDPESQPTKDVRTGKGGRMSQEQVAQALLESDSVRLEDLPEASLADQFNNSNVNGIAMMMPDDEIVYTYTSSDGRNAKVRRRGDGTLYIDYDLF
jgi:hypothetical protein